MLKEHKDRQKGGGNGGATVWHVTQKYNGSKINAGTNGVCVCVSDGANMIHDAN